MGKPLKLFINPKTDAVRVPDIQAAASAAGVKLIIGTIDTASAEYRHNVHPTGLSPAVETECGRYVAGTLAVLKYVADKSDDAFAGRTSYEQAVVDSFLQVVETSLVSLDGAKPEAAATLKELNKWLETRTFLASERLTVADVAVALALVPVYAKAKGVEALVELNRFMDTVLNHPKVAPYATREYKVEAPKKEGKEGKKDDKKDKKKDKKADKPEWKKEAEAKKKQPEKKVLDGGVFDLRVGEVKECTKHEKADKLYVEKIDVGEPELRQICSGLVQHMEASDINGKKIVVMCNLKPKEMVGVPSNGMVMCSTGPDGKVHLCQVPEGAKAGDKIIIEKYETGAPKEIVPVKKLPDLLNEFHTDDNGTVMWKDAPLVVKGKGACASPHHKNCPVK